MTLPDDEFANRELSIEELDAIAAGGFWPSLKTLAHIGQIIGKIGLGIAIGVSIFAGASVATGGAATSRNQNMN